MQGLILPVLGLIALPLGVSIAMFWIMIRKLRSVRRQLQ